MNALICDGGYFLPLASAQASPFSPETAAIREQDVASFERATNESGVSLPKTVAPYLGRLLWMYQMGLILYWVYDRSPEQRRTATLFEKSLQMILMTLKFAGLPILTPMHRLAADLLDAVYAQEPDETPTGEQKP